MLELGAGVGTVGIAAALAGARTVLITDINETALGLVSVADCGRACRHSKQVWEPGPIDGLSTSSWHACAGTQNVSLNGESAHQSVWVGRLDWAHPPHTLPAIESAELPGGEAAGAAMADRVDLLLAADVVNADGLSELVYRCVPRANSTWSRLHGKHTYMRRGRVLARSSRSVGWSRSCSQDDLALSSAERALCNGLPQAIPSP